MNMDETHAILREVEDRLRLRLNQKTKCAGIAERLARTSIRKRTPLEKAEKSELVLGLQLWRYGYQVHKKNRTYSVVTDDEAALCVVSQLTPYALLKFAENLRPPE
jgi:hypothetical protein